jgi:ATP synthase F1 complex assembly factor 1
VFKGDGKFFVLLAEWQDKHCIFTFLDDYKRNPGRAEPYLSVSLFDDFLARKQLVLVRGDFSGHLTKADATHLLTLLRFFYFQEPRWVETFNKDAAAFDFNALLRDCPQPPALLKTPPGGGSNATSGMILK